MKKSFCNQTSLVMLNQPINISHDTKDPFTFHYVEQWIWQNKHPRFVASKSSKFNIHHLTLLKNDKSISHSRRFKQGQVRWGWCNTCFWLKDLDLTNVLLSVKLKLVRLVVEMSTGRAMPEMALLVHIFVPHFIYHPCKFSTWYSRESSSCRNFFSII